MIAGGVQREARQPGAEGGIAPKAGQRVPGFDERLLRHLRRVVRIGDDRVGDPIDALVLPFQQAAKGGVIARATTRQQRRLGLRVSHRHLLSTARLDATRAGNVRRCRRERQADRHGRVRPPPQGVVVATVASPSQRVRFASGADVHGSPAIGHRTARSVREPSPPPSRSPRATTLRAATVPGRPGARRAVS